jgi:hypothetical protein
VRQRRSIRLSARSRTIDGTSQVRNMAQRAKERGQGRGEAKRNPAGLADRARRRTRAVVDKVTKVRYFRTSWRAIAFLNVSRAIMRRDRGKRAMRPESDRVQVYRLGRGGGDNLGILKPCDRSSTVPFCLSTCSTAIFASTHAEALRFGLSFSIISRAISAAG